MEAEHVEELVAGFGFLGGPLLGGGEGGEGACLFDGGDFAFEVALEHAVAEGVGGGLGEVGGEEGR